LIDLSLLTVTDMGGGGAVTGGRVAEREGTGAAAPERPRRGEACCLSPQGELHASSAGADKLRSSAQLAAARHRPAAAITGTEEIQAIASTVGTGRKGPPRNLGELRGGRARLNGSF